MVIFVLFIIKGLLSNNVLFSFSIAFYKEILKLRFDIFKYSRTTMLQMHWNLFNDLMNVHCIIKKVYHEE